jgi:3'(2'), 5'-bisphosphate nucleotidase
MENKENHIYKTLISKVNEIAVAAGHKILEVYNSDMDFGVEAKSDNSPLTIADKEANKVIVAGLEALEIQFPIISEENKLLDYADRKDYDHFWLVDPLDGTKEFIKKNGEFTVNIALIKGNSPVMGVVYTPVTKELFYAYKGNGAYKSIDGAEQKISVNSFSQSDQNLRVICSRSHLNEETQNFVDALDKPELVSKGSSLKFLMLAEGKAELYPRIAPTMEWDTGAAQMILEEAGGTVLQYGTDQPLAYNKENLLNPFFIASANKV